MDEKPLSEDDKKAAEFIAGLFAFSRDVLQVVRQIDIHQVIAEKTRDQKPRQN